MFSSSCLIQIPMKFFQTFLPRRIQPDCRFLPTKMSLATLDSATVISVTLLRVLQWTNMFRENPHPCPAFAWQTQTSKIFTSLKTGVWQFDDLTTIHLNQLGELRLTMKHARICQNTVQAVFNSSSLPTDSSQLQQRIFSYTLSRLPGVSKCVSSDVSIQGAHGHGCQ